MKYDELQRAYPSIDRVMQRMQESIAAGLDADAMLSWALGQVGKIKNVGHRAAAVEKVKEFHRLRVATKLQFGGVTMREILFRGKLKATEKWAYGNLVVNRQGTHIITPDQTPIGKYGAVIPATVGQFSGLADKNGAKIFEGDIITLHTLYNNETTIEVVHFSNGGFFAGTYPIYNVGAPCNQNNIELLGNIHDNPELLNAAK